MNNAQKAALLEILFPVDAGTTTAPAQGSPPDEIYKVGDTRLFRTVTFYAVGTISKVTATEVELSNASWVADTGRFGECLRSGTIKEYEGVGDGYTLGRMAIVDSFMWRHDLPDTNTDK